MTKFKTLAAAAAIACAFAFSPVQAQFVGGPTAVTTVKNVLDNAHDDQLVILEGFLTKQVRHEKYMFRDATGEILVEVDDEVFQGQRVDPKTKIRIEGEFENELLQKGEVDVHRLTIVR